MKQKLYGTIPMEKRLSMETWLQSYLQENAADLRAKIHEDREGWFAEFHFGWGMHVRNALRKAGFTEQFLGVGNLDDVYVEAVEHAVLVNSAGEIMTGIPVKHFWTTKKKFAAIVIFLIAAHIIVKLLSNMLDAGG